MNNYCTQPQAHPDRCGCLPDRYASPDYCRGLEQERDYLRGQVAILRQHKIDYMEAAEGTRKALEAECERLRQSMTGIVVRHFAKQLDRVRRDAELEQYLSDGIAQLEAERDAMVAQLANPEAVFVNMKRGAIAKPSLRSMIDLYGEVVNGDEAQLLEIARLRADLADAKSARDAYGQNALDMQAQRDALAAELETLRKDASAGMFLTLTAELAKLRAELAAIKGQEPVLWFRSLIGAQCKPDGRCYDVVFSPCEGFMPLYALPPAQPEVQRLPYWEPCNPGCDPDFNGSRSRHCAELCHNARAALATSAGNGDQQRLVSVPREVLELLRDIGAGCSRRVMPSEQTLAEWADRIDAALAASTGQQGEGGGK